ncbi:MAG: hypothetical protein GWP08_17960 [Nitrospiraceae bacterium]|nr:hypothetical protein [Nitrospiraceae bacterium]
MLVMGIVLVCGMLAAAPPPLLHFECARTAGAIVVDGESDDKAWDNAEPITDFRLWETFERPTERTSVRFCYDDDYLYALFECDDPDIFTLYDSRDAYIWESDAVELFLKPDADNPIYYEFEVAPNNAVFDARMVNTGSGGFRRWAKWNCDVRTAVQVRGSINEWKDRDEGYTVEIAIPLAALSETIGDRPLRGQTWKFAAVRVDVSVTLDKEERSSTANVPGGDIHQKNGYFSLTFK